MVADETRLTTVYLVRHGESAGNTKGFFQGRTDCELSKNGVLQLGVLAERFKDIPLDKIYTSPLKRTRDTAAAINVYHNLPILLDEGLVEINGGVFEGLSWEEIPLKYPAEFAVWREKSHVFAAPQSESMYEVYERMRKTVLALVTANAGKTLCLVSHGCAIKNFLCFALGLPLSELEQVPWSDNTSVSKLYFDADLTPTVAFCNDASHLDSLNLEKPSYWNSFRK